MSEKFEDLPPELLKQVSAFLRESNDGYEITDMRGLVELIAEHGQKHPVLYSLVNLNEDAVIAHYKETGEVPPGIKIVHTSQESDKVTRLECSLLPCATRVLRNGFGSCGGGVDHPIENLPRIQKQALSNVRCAIAQSANWAARMNHVFEVLEYL